MKTWWILLCALFALLSCGDKRTAGSASVTTNGSVAGILRDSSGNAMSHATAVLIPNTSDPADSQLALLTDLTDEQGRFYFSNVPVGEYRLLVRNSDSSLAATIDPITVDTSAHVKLDTLPLSPVATIHIAQASYSFSLNDRFYIPGTDIEHIVSAQDLNTAEVNITGVPFGLYEQIIQVPAASTALLPLLIEPLEVSLVSQAVMPDYEGASTIPVGFVTQDRSENFWGGAHGDTVRVADSSALRIALKDTLPHVILIQKWIQGDGSMLSVRSNKTILGVGDSAGFDSLGLSIRSDSNIVIRNLNFRRGAIDAISIEDSSRHVWIDHNSFTHYGDGLVDVKRASDFITVSWNVFRKHRSVSLVGHSDNNGAQDSTHLRMTYHHNWFDSIENTAPRIRYGTVHLFNNVYTEITGFAIASTQHASVVVEDNLFHHVTSPTVVGHTSPLPGDLVESGNLYENSGALVTYGTAFDPASIYPYTPGAVSYLKNLLFFGAGAGKLKSLR